MDVKSRIKKVEIFIKKHKSPEDTVCIVDDIPNDENMVTCLYIPSGRKEIYSKSEYRAILESRHNMTIFTGENDLKD